MINFNGIQYREMPDAPHVDVLELLNHHHQFSLIGIEYTARYGHGRFQQDTKSWTELIASAITQIRGYDGNVPPGGGDIEDGSDVKGYNALGANDQPRWNGVIHIGHQQTRPTLSDGTYEPDSAYSPAEFDTMPYLILCAWHEIEQVPTFSVWIIRGNDTDFRTMIDGIADRFNQGEITGNIQFFGPKNGQIGRTRGYKIHEGMNVVFSNGYYLEMPLLYRATLVEEEYVDPEWFPDAVTQDCTLLHRPDSEGLPPNCTELLTAGEASTLIGISIAQFRESYTGDDSHVPPNYWRRDLLGI